MILTILTMQINFCHSKRRVSRCRSVRDLALWEAAVHCAVAVEFCESPIPLEVMGQVPGCDEPKEMGQQQLQTEAEIEGHCPEEKSNSLNTHLKRRPLMAQWIRRSQNVEQFLWRNYGDHRRYLLRQKEQDMTSCREQSSW